MITSKSFSVMITGIMVGVLIGHNWLGKGGVHSSMKQISFALQQLTAMEVVPYQSSAEEEEEEQEAEVTVVKKSTLTSTPQQQIEESPTQQQTQAQAPQHNIECHLREPQGNETAGQKKLSCQDLNDPIYGGLSDARGEWKFVGLGSVNRRSYPPNICCPATDRTTGNNQKQKQNWKDLYCSFTKFGGFGDGRNYTGDSQLYQQMPGNGCYCSPEDDSWIWYPSTTTSSSRHNQHQQQQNPSFLHFEKKKACELLGNRTVLLVGDSTMQQTATTLMNAFYKTPCTTRIRFTQGDTLIKELHGPYNRGVHWKDAIAALSPQLPSIVIVGTGPHVLADEAFINIVQNVTADMKELLLQTTTKQYPKMHFIWKTQQPGGCTPKENGVPYPDNPYLAFLSMLTNNTRYNHELLHNSYWDRDLFLIKHVYNTIQQEENKGHGLLLSTNMHIMDLRPLYSRTDKKIGSGKTKPSDCLHFCSPGPLDIVGPLFYQLLQKIFG